MKALLFLFLFPTLSIAGNFPDEWFAEVPRENAPVWEILPQDVRPGEVILSKRTELGVFSNFAHTPFILDGKKFSSVEGLWQSLKYPDPELEHDERRAINTWPFTREQVEQMVAFEAKRAGDLANKIYADYQLKNVSWFNHRFNYIDHAEGSLFHYHLIKSALKAKLDQTPGLWDLLLRTECLILKPDHRMNENSPASFHYYRLFMELRTERQTLPCGR